MGQQHILSNSILIGPAVWQTCFNFFYYCDLLGDGGRGLPQGVDSLRARHGASAITCILCSDRNIPWTGSSRRVTKFLDQILCEFISLTLQMQNLKVKKLSTYKFFPLVRLAPHSSTIFETTTRISNSRNAEGVIH